MDKQIAIIRATTIARSGIEWVVGLIRAGIAVVPIPFGHFRYAAALRNLADVEYNQVGYCLVSGNRRDGDEEQRPVVVIWVDPDSV